MAQLAPESTLKPPPSEYLRLPFRWFAFWRIVILGLHIVACAYNTAYAVYYWSYGDTYLSYALEGNGIGLPRDRFHVISYTHMILASIHAICALVMVIGSLWRHSLVFSPRSAKKNEGCNKPVSMTGGLGAINLQKSPACYARIPKLVSSLYGKIAGRRGLLGVNGRYFHVVIFGRELLQMTLQTIQAIRMSKYLPRVLLNRFYVVLIAINCWSKLFVYSRWFWNDEARRRFAVIMCDCVLNVMSTLGVSSIVFLRYIDFYQAKIIGFDFTMIGDQEWYSQMLNDAQVIIVVSWFDMISRIAFSLGLVASAADLKDLLRCGSKRRNRIAYTGDNAIVPTDQRLGLRINETQRGNLNNAPRPQVEKLNGPIARDIPQHDQALVQPRGSKMRSQVGIIATKGTHALFATWGLGIVALHVCAALQTPLFECAPKVHPIAGTLPSCYVVNFNCYYLGISGSNKEVESAWNRFDRNTSMKISISHCPALEIPRNFQDFQRLQQIEVYNATIVNWDANNAITSASHPAMVALSLVRVNMTGGLLPPGLQSPDFPTKLRDINFCETNLQQLPDDLDSKWPVNPGIYMENSKLTTIPLALALLKPTYLMLGGNPLVELPPELFEADLGYLTLDRTQLTQLPQAVSNPSTAMFYLDIANTNISFFWWWVDPLVEDMFEGMQLVAAGGTPYCSDLDMIMSGASSDFSMPYSMGYSSILMNASQDNWEALTQAVNCSPVDGVTTFPLQSWDDMYRLVD
ncbi:hypothetical protein ON010_g4851 [Phytophthora cinnamomi]|nr:hypothetical protein ON010_g4851 [Phytophthora cinnamomi]